MTRARHDDHDADPVEDAAEAAEQQAEPAPAAEPLIEFRWLCVPGRQTLQYREAGGDWVSVPYVVEES